jgi:hypothetical protein
LWRADTSGDATEVGAVARVHLDASVRLDEERHLDLGARLERGGLGAAGRAIALQPRLGVGDGELDRCGELDVRALPSCIATMHSWFSSIQRELSLTTALGIVTWS